MKTGGNYAAVFPQMPQMSNGRLDLLSEAPKLNYQKVAAASYENFSDEATRGQIQPTPVSRVYFSPENIEALQQGLRYRVWVESDRKLVIGRQSETELRIIMRSIYYQYARNDARDVLSQVRELNGRVLDWAVPEVLSNSLQHQKYIVDASTLPMPLEHAQIQTSKGTRTLEIKSFL